MDEDDIHNHDEDDDDSPPPPPPPPIRNKHPRGKQLLKTGTFVKTAQRRLELQKFQTLKSKQPLLQQPPQMLPGVKTVFGKMAPFSEAKSNSAQDLAANRRVTALVEQFTQIQNYKGLDLIDRQSNCRAVEDAIRSGNRTLIEQVRTNQEIWRRQHLVEREEALAAVRAIRSTMTNFRLNDLPKIVEAKKAKEKKEVSKEGKSEKEEKAEAKENHETLPIVPEKTTGKIGLEGSSSNESIFHSLTNISKSGSKEDSSAP